MPDTSKRTAWRADSPSATAVSPDAATVEPPTSSCALSRKEPRVADLAKARVFGAKRGVRDESGDVVWASTGLSGDGVRMGGQRES